MTQVRPEQLGASLKRNLAAVYFIHGDEPLLVGECADAVRAAARAQGYTDREVFTVEPGFDWASLQAASDSLSLFAEKRLLELRMPSGKPGDKGARALRDYCERPPEDTLLLITGGKLEPAARRSKWVQALDKAGVSVPVWPVGAAQLPAWIERRMRAAGMQPTREALALLAERVEGNLLACAQEIEKLFLLHGPGAVDADAIAALVTDSARYDIFGLVDAALLGQAARSQRMLAGLRGEGVEPVLVLWALAREIRSLATMAGELSGGGAIGQLLAKYRVWDKRKAAVGGALKRLSVHELRALLGQCAHLDRVIKGRAAGSPWDDLLQLTLRLAGADILRVTA